MTARTGSRVLLMLCLSAGFCFASNKPAPPPSPDQSQQPFYQPQMLPSAQDAAQKIQLMAPRLALGSHYAALPPIVGATRMMVDPSSLQIFFPNPNAAQPPKKHSLLSLGKKAQSTAQQSQETINAVSSAPQAPQTPDASSAPLTLPTGDFKMPTTRPSATRPPSPCSFSRSAPCATPAAKLTSAWPTTAVRCSRRPIPMKTTC